MDFEDAQRTLHHSQPLHPTDPAEASTTASAAVIISSERLRTKRLSRQRLGRQSPSASKRMYTKAICIRVAIGVLCETRLSRC